jgi:hypothetical protein
MTIKIPTKLCVHDREKLLTFITFYGINTNKQWYVARDLDTGVYLAIQ